MKKIALLGMVLLAAVSCKQVTPEERIAEISTYCSNHENDYATKLAQLDDTRRTDYLTLVQANQLGAAEVWLLDTDESRTLVAEYRGRKPRKGVEPPISLLTASLDDPQACAAVLAAMEAFKKLKIRPASTLRTAFYSPAADSASTSGLDALHDDLAEAGEVITYDLDVSSSNGEAPCTFLIEENPMFVEQFLSVIPPYFSPLGDYHFQQGVYPNDNWPINAATYRYTLDGNALPRESAAIATLVFLLN